VKARAVALALLAAMVAAGAARQARAASIDPLLLPVLSGQSTPQALGLALGRAQDAAGEGSLSVSLRFSGNLDDLRNLGIRFGGILGDVATADVSLAQLRLLATHPAVRSIEGARPLHLQLNASVPISGLLTTSDFSVGLRYPNATGDGWTDNSLTGRGVLIGILDTGLDLLHDDFLKPDGRTRVLSVWDQSTAVGRSPLGFSYGAECTADQVNARDCPMVDRDGHGTHVAGIAAGDGSATGGIQSPYRYVGMAPEADLLVVKMADLSTPRVIDALSYLKAKATALGKPIVVNLSFGSSLGPHDGTTNLEQAVNTFTGPDDIPGAVVVAAAGNDGQTVEQNPLHAVGCFQTGSSPCPTGVTPRPGAIPEAVSFVVPDETRAAFLEIWYPGAATLGVRVTEPSACATSSASLAGTPVVTASTSCGNIVIAAGNTNVANGDRSTIVALTSSAQLTPGLWSLAITGDDLPGNSATRFDVWSDAEPSENAPVFNTLGSPGTTIIAPASSAEAIAVAPYVSKTTWTSLIAGCCALPATHGTLGTLATYASQGPLRPCTSCGAVPQKPDLAAPGLMITSSFSSRIPDDPLLDAQVDPDRVHYALEGSSMAAPHVTGAAALLLQVNANLTAREVKAYLLGNTSFPRPLPIEQWGQGRLHVKAAVDAVRAAGDDPPPAALTGVRVTSVHSRRVSLAWDPSPDLDLRYFRVFRRSEADGTTAMLADTVPATATTFEDPTSNTRPAPEMTNEALYTYSFQAVDINGQSGPLSVEVPAVPTAGEGSVGLCFIATAAYGSAWHPHVVSLRAFRDRQLRPYAIGRAGIAAYETVGPPLARLIAPHPALRAAARGALTPIVLLIEHPWASAAVLGLGLLGVIGLRLRRRC
jgi:subtilisin family serine protease